MRGRRDGENKVPISEALLSVRNHLVPVLVISSSSEVMNLNVMNFSSSEVMRESKRDARYLGYSLLVKCKISCNGWTVRAIQKRCQTRRTE